MSKKSSLRRIRHYESKSNYCIRSALGSELGRGPEHIPQQHTADRFSQ